MPPETRRRVIAEAAVLGALTVAGVVLLVLQAGTVVTAMGIVLLGLGLVGATVAVFLEVGLSEDRDRRRHPRG
jgi:hypothetical protein